MLRNKKFHSGGFVLVEFAIALPLLILLLYGLTTVSLNIFRLQKDQLADYVLEEEAEYVMERITKAARVAKEIEAFNASNSIKIIYHTVDDDTGRNDVSDQSSGNYTLYTIKDVWETQYFLAYKKAGSDFQNLYAERQKTSKPTSPITGENYFGNTKINSLQFSELKENVLHITLEMESLKTGHKIKIATAVFMPGCEKKDGLPHE